MLGKDTNLVLLEEIVFQVNFVLANDRVTRHNLLINAANECLIASDDRIEVLKGLVTKIKAL